MNRPPMSRPRPGAATARRARGGWHSRFALLIAVTTVLWAQTSPARARRSTRTGS